LIDLIYNIDAMEGPLAGAIPEFDLKVRLYNLMILSFTICRTRTNGTKCSD